MANEITVLDPPPDDNIAQRVISDIIRNVSANQIYVDSMGKKMSYRQYLSIMIWDLITNGECFYSDGKQMMIDDPNQWIALVKFVSGHLDGAPRADVAVTNLNTFKVYIGVDESKV